MTRFTLVACLVTLLSPSLSHAAGTPVHEWSKALGSTQDDYIYDVAADAAGNVYVTGSFRGTVNFGGANLVSAGQDDGFLAKYDASGALVWSLRFGNTANDWGYSLAVGPTGDVILAGSFRVSVNLGGGTLTSAGANDVLLAKFNAIGVHQWSQRLGGTTNESATVATDVSGNILLAGYFDGTTSFGGAALVSAGNSDVVVAKYNPAGTHQWSQRFGSIDVDGSQGVAADAAGNVIVGGSFGGTVSFGGSNLVSAGAEDAFLAKYSPTGTHVWSKRFGSVGTDQITDVARDAANNIVIGGDFMNTVNFGGSNLVSAGAQDIVLAKYNSSGLHLWSIRQGSTGWDSARGIDVSQSGDVFATGWFVGTVSFGSTTLVNTDGIGDVFVSRTNPAGIPQWATQCTGPDDEVGYDVAVSGLDDVCAVGYLLGSEIAIADVVLPNAGGYDGFVTRWNMKTGEPVITSIADIANDQGRKVMIRFEASGADNPAVPDPTTSYVALRRDDPAPSMTSGGDPSLLADGWVEVASVKAFANEAYLIEASTIGDSTLVLGPYLSVFKIRAASDVPSHYYDSLPDSGYSKDNLAPGAPLNFIYNAGDLSWNESTAEDFDFFTVYGSNTDNFGAATVVDYSITTAMDVSASPYAYYYITATDFSGNEGKPAKVNSLTGAGGTPTSYVLSVSNYPNPFNPRTTVSYTVPSRGMVRISVYDTRGALVATLFNGDRSAGVYSVEWDGRAEGASVAASGVYFARIEHNGSMRSKKMVLLK